MKNIVALLCFLLGFLSCNRSEIAKSNQGRFFLVAHAGAGDPFWNVEFNGAKKAASDLGLDLQIIAPETPNDIARQVELLNSAIATKPSGIAVTIPDENAFVASLKKAKELSIPVVAFNTKPNDSALVNKDYLAFIGMDDYLAGRRLAKEAFESGKLKSNVAVAIHQAGHVGLEKRYAGINHVLSEHNIKVDKIDITSDASQAQQIIKGYLSKNPDTSAIFFTGAQGVHSAGRLLQKNFPNLMLASFDLTPLTLEMIKDGGLSFSIDQQPFMQGYMAVAQLSLRNQFSLVPSDLNTGVGIVDKSNWQELESLVKKGVR